MKRASAKQQYVGLDVHKNSIQVAVMDQDGKVLRNTKIDNTDEDVRREFARIPGSARCVMESSSVWYGLFRFVSDELNMDVILSNPFETRAIAVSKKKTDRVDAHILADLLRGEYISACHVPSHPTVQNRQLTRSRAKLIGVRTGLKNQIHAILLQNRIRIPGRSFSKAWTAEVNRLGDFRIEDRLMIIDAIDERIMRMELRIRDAVRDSPDATILESIPGFGRYTALTIAAEIDGIDRFADSGKLCAYAGLVPSVRSSADVVHHGRITRTGSRILRWALVEAVHTHIRYAPDSDISAFYVRVAKKRGKSKAAVAAAAKMLRVIYWMLSEKREFVTRYGQDRRARTNNEGRAS